MRLKIFLIVFVLSLPFWWGVNALAENLEDFWFWQEMAKSPQIFVAQVKPYYQYAKIKRLAENLEIKAEAAISIEINKKTNKKRVLFKKNPQERFPIASLTKLMTALVVFDLDETYNFSQLIPITKEAVEQEGVSRYGELKEGEYLSVESLLYIMLIESSNDAAFALAEAIGEDGFVELMNLYTRDLGLENTYFIDSTGLDPDDPQGPINYSSASDLVKLTNYILKKYPRIFEIAINNSYEVLNPDGSLHHFIPENTNELLGEIPEIIGGKTAWTPAAGGCLLLVLKNPSKNSYFINVILGAEDRFEEMQKLIELIYHLI